MNDPLPKGPRPSIWNRLPQDRGGAGTYDLAANVLVGFGIGWLAQHFFPGLRPWGYVGGVVLGAASGFYQLFKAQRSGPTDKPRGSKG